MIVLDASVALAWVLIDESDPDAEEAMRSVGRDGAFVPGIWRYEMLNALLVNERRGRLGSQDVADTLADLRHLRIAVDEDADDATILRLARRHGISAYDASYLELAKRRGLPLASLDKRLRTGALAEGVQIATARGTRA